MLTRVSSLVVALAAMLMVGCSEMPTTQLESAEKALLAARSAEAEQYAPEIYRQAVDTLNAAKDEMAKQAGRFALLRSYGDSRQLLESATNLASTAESSAVEEKEMVKSETEQQIKSARMLLASVREEFKTAPTGKGTKADLKLIDSEITAAESMIADAELSFTNSKYTVAQAKLATATDRLDQLMTEILAAKKRTTTAPRA